ncbi:hypothetical protein HDU82_006993, partial [Entophlyctis luteolus]
MPASAPSPRPSPRHPQSPSMALPLRGCGPADGAPTHAAPVPAPPAPAPSPPPAYTTAPNGAPAAVKPTRILARCIHAFLAAATAAARAANGAPQSRVTPAPAPAKGDQSFEYILRIVQATVAPPATLMLSLLLTDKILDKMALRGDAMMKGFFFESSDDVSQKSLAIWSVGIILADAALNDNAFAASSWAQVTVFKEARVVAAWKRWVGDLLDWNFDVSEEDLCNGFLARNPVIMDLCELHDGIYDQIAAIRSAQYRRKLDIDEELSRKQLPVSMSAQYHIQRLKQRQEMQQKEAQLQNERIHLQHIQQVSAQHQHHQQLLTQQQSSQPPKHSRLSIISTRRSLPLIPQYHYRTPSPDPNATGSRVSVGAASASLGASSQKQLAYTRPPQPQQHMQQPSLRYRASDAVLGFSSSSQRRSVTFDQERRNSSTLAHASTFRPIINGVGSAGTSTVNSSVSGGFGSLRRPFSSRSSANSLRTLTPTMGDISTSLSSTSVASSLLLPSTSSELLSVGTSRTLNGEIAFDEAEEVEFLARSAPNCEVAVEQRPHQKRILSHQPQQWMMTKLLVPDSHKNSAVPLAAAAVAAEPSDGYTGSGISSGAGGGSLRRAAGLAAARRASAALLALPQGSSATVTSATASVVQQPRTDSAGSHAKVHFGPAAGTSNGGAASWGTGASLAWRDVVPQKNVWGKPASPAAAPALGSRIGSAELKRTSAGGTGSGGGVGGGAPWISGVARGWGSGRVSS